MWDPIQKPSVGTGQISGSVWILCRGIFAYLLKYKTRMSFLIRLKNSGLPYNHTHN